MLFLNKLWHLHANLQKTHVEACQRTFTFKYCNCLVFCWLSSYGGSQCSEHISLHPCLPIKPARCYNVIRMASSFGLHIKPVAVGSVLNSHSRHASQSFTDIKLDSVKDIADHTDSSGFFFLCLLMSNMTLQFNCIVEEENIK